MMKRFLVRKNQKQSKFHFNLMERDHRYVVLSYMIYYLYFIQVGDDEDEDDDSEAEGVRNYTI